MALHGDGVMSLFEERLGCVGILADVLRLEGLELLIKQLQEGQGTHAQTAAVWLGSTSWPVAYVQAK
eukprot:scaffold250430_cov21-Tisochrysis_lutea.AAC.1